MTLDELRKKHKADILRIAEQYGVTNIRVFGSMARGEAGPDSDVDLLVTLTRPLGFKYAGLELDVTDAIGIPAQVISDRGLHHLIRNNILSEAVPL